MSSHGTRNWNDIAAVARRILDRALDRFEWPEGHDPDDWEELRALLSTVDASRDEPTEADPLEWPEGVVGPDAVAVVADAVAAVVELLAESHELLRQMAAQNAALYNQAAISCIEAESEVKELRALVGGRPAAPTRDELGQRLTDAQQHNETLKGERDEARAAVVEAREILDALIEWFGAPDWAGPDLPVELSRRIATLLGPRSAMDRVRAPWSPTPSLPAGVGIVRLSDCETFTLGERTHDDDTGQDGYEVNQGGFISDEAITSGRWALAVTDAVVALLSRPAEPPEADLHFQLEVETGMSARWFGAFAEAKDRATTLEAVLRHALAHWAVTPPFDKSAGEVLAEWDDTDWADSSWSPAEQEVIRSALSGVAAEPNEEHGDDR